jgi:hypothetical protein
MRSRQRNAPDRCDNLLFLPMSNLTPSQLEKIVGEVQRLSLQKEEELDRDRVQEILAELDLAPDLLDEAIVQLQRREALEVQKKRNFLIVSGFTIVALVAIAGVFFLSQQRAGELAKISVREDVITKFENLNAIGAKVNTVDKKAKEQLFYHVTLKDAPVGKKLSLGCDWLNSKGEVVKQNRYQTKEVNTPLWNTRCQYQLPDNAASGKWQVKLLLDGKQLSDESFIVK